MSFKRACRFSAAATPVKYEGDIENGNNVSIILKNVHCPLDPSKMTLVWM